MVIENDGHHMRASLHLHLDGFIFRHSLNKARRSLGEPLSIQPDLKPRSPSDLELISARPGREEGSAQCGVAIHRTTGVRQLYGLHQVLSLVAKW